MHLNNYRSLIAGPPGSGKTYLAAGMFGKEKRALVWNSPHDVEFTARSTVQAQGGTESAEKLWEIMKKPDATFRIEWWPRDFSYNESKTRMRAPSLETISSLCMDARNMHFYFDEAHKLLGAGYAPPHFLTILQEGRHAQVSLTMITHRMARIPKDFTQEVLDFYLFQTDSEQDLDDIEELCGSLARRRVEELKITDLRGKVPIPGEYYHVSKLMREGKVIDAASGRVVLTDSLRRSKELFD